jgi:Ankyrin repeats (3 copies)
VKSNSLKPDTGRDLKRMSFDELRREAESLLQKYHTCRDKGELRTISNRFTEIDAMLEQYQKEVSNDVNDSQESASMEVIAVPTDTASFSQPSPNSTSLQPTETLLTNTTPQPGPPKTKTDSVLCQTIAATTVHPSASVSMLDRIPLANVLDADCETVPHAVSEPESPIQPETEPAEMTTATGAQTTTQDATPVAPAETTPPAKPISALDLMPLPKAEHVDDAAASTAAMDQTSGPCDMDAPEKKKKRHYEGSGDLQSALQSVWNLVSDNDAPATNTVETPVAADTTATSEPSPTLIEESTVIPPIPEISDDSPAPTPAPPAASVANDIPKSVSETLPKFQVAPKSRVCNRCGRETRLTREKCEACSYVDQSLGILDSVIAGNVQKVEEILLAKPLVITTRTSKHEWTLLHMAASGGNPRMVETLIKKGISINAQNKSGKTPLHYAAAKGHREIVSILLNNHADTTPQYHGQTAVDMARSNGHDEIAAMLVKAAD